MSRGGAEREGTQNPKQAPGSELSVQSPTRGLNPGTIERKTEHEWGEGQSERERETQNPKRAPGSELSAQSLMWDSNSRT